MANERTAHLFHSLHANTYSQKHGSWSFNCMQLALLQKGLYVPFSVSSFFKLRLNADLFDSREAFIL